MRLILLPHFEGVCFIVGVNETTLRNVETKLARGRGLPGPRRPRLGRRRGGRLQAVLEACDHFCVRRFPPWSAQRRPETEPLLSRSGYEEEEHRV